MDNVALWKTTPKERTPPRPRQRGVVKDKNGVLEENAGRRKAWRRSRVVLQGKEKLAPFTRANNFARFGG